MVVKGTCSPALMEVKELFQSLFDQGEETGANFTVIRNDEVLINIFGGLKNSKQEWDEETIVNTFSLSKGIYASCVAKLIEKKELDIEKKVSFYWPEFKKNNKENIKIKDILSHQSGLYRFKSKISNQDLLDFNKIIKILEKQDPDHTPGQQTYYHAKTHGYLVENIIRKITKLKLKDFFKENISNLLNINFHFGVDEKDFHKIANLEESQEKEKNEIKEFNAFNNPQHNVNFYNSKKWRLTGVPSMGGHGSALAIAKLYYHLTNDLITNEKKIISSENFKKILKQANFGEDKSLKIPIKWTYSGYILRGGWIFGKNKDSFGHNGWGGSLGFGDPALNMGIAYVTQKINPGMQADTRAIKLIKKFYEIINN